MPTVQTYGAPKINLPQAENARFRAADAGDGGVGRSVSQFGEQLGQYADNEAKIRAQDLVLQADQKMKAVASGFKQQMGRNAIDNRGSADAALKSAYKETLEAAKDPLVRNYVQPVLDRYQSLYTDDVTAHGTQQERVYAKEVGAGRMANFADSAVSTWDKPELHNQWVESGKAQLRENLALDGLNDPEIVKVKEREFVTGVRLGVVDQLLAGDRQDDAIAYGEAHADELSAEGQSTLGKLLKAPKQLRFGISGADMVMGADTVPNARAGDGPVHSSASYFTHGIVPIEGGTGKNGAFLTSPKGAIGPAQVMPDTAPEAAKLAGLPYDETKYKTDKVYNLSLGKAYYNKQLLTFGDPAKAAAAYNAGAGRVNKAIATAKEKGGSWIDHLPAETRKYVGDFKKRMGIAAPVDGVDEADVYSRLDTTAIQENWTPEQKKIVQEEVDRRVGRVTKLKSDEQSDAYDAAVSKAVALGDGFTDVSQLGAAFTRMSPQQQITMTNMAASNLKAVTTQQAPKAYGDVYNGIHNMSLFVPQEFAKTNLEPYRNRMTPSEFSGLLATQAKLNADGNEVTRRAAITSTISFFSKTDKNELDPKNNSENFTRVYTEMDKYLKDVTGGKRSATDDELKAAYQRATMNVQVPGDWWGMNEMPRFQVERGQEFSVDIPANVRSRIVAAAQARGRSLTENQITQAYIAGKGKDW